MPDEQDDQQTTDDQSATQATESDQQTSRDQVTDESAAQTTVDQGQQKTDDQGSSQETTDEQSQAQQTPSDQSQGQDTTGDQGGGQETPSDQSQGQKTTGDQGSQTTQAAEGGPTKSSVGHVILAAAIPGEEMQSAGTGSSDQAVAPDKEYVEKVLRGTEGISTIGETAAIIASAETVVAVIEPIGGVLAVVSMILTVWNSLELPDRTCAYQGLVYGLMYGALNKGDPQPNPTWPDLKDAPKHDEKFFEGVGEAKKRLADGQSGTRIKNLILLDVAKRGEKAVINNLWQHVISDSDQLLKRYTLDWPTVGAY